MHQGSAKAWHIHEHQLDWWYVAVGTLKVALHDKRKDSPTYGEHQVYNLNDERRSVLYVPKGIAHGFYTLTEDAMVLDVDKRRPLIHSIGFAVDVSSALGNYIIII